MNPATLREIASRQAIDYTMMRRSGGGLRHFAEVAGVSVVSGEGSYLYDRDGRSYLDLVGGYGVASIGHCHPAWTSALSRQVDTLAHSILYTPQLAEYLEGLDSVLPDHLDRFALFSGGAEAVETGIRLAQSATGRTRIISFVSGFHGKTLGTRFAGGGSTSETLKVAPRWIDSARFPECVEHGAGDYEQCIDAGQSVIAELARRDWSDVAAVLIEPVLGTAGNVFPERGFLPLLSKLCRTRGALLISDESITGFGRLGDWLGASTFGVEPDIAVLGKGMGGGFPLSGVAASSYVWEASSMLQVSATSSSYGGNPMACVAGRAVIDVVSELLADRHLDDVARQLREGLVEIAARSPWVSRPRGRGMLLGFDLRDPVTGRLAEPSVCHEFVKRCASSGVLVAANRSRVRLTPPLTMSSSEVAHALEALSKVSA